MNWLHELVWVALAVLVATVLVLVIVSCILGANAGGMG